MPWTAPEDEREKPKRDKSPDHETDNGNTEDGGGPNTLTSGEEGHDFPKVTLGKPVDGEAAVLGTSDSNGPEVNTNVPVGLDGKPDLGVGFGQGTDVSADKGGKPFVGGIAKTITAAGPRDAMTHPYPHLLDPS